MVFNACYWCVECPYHAENSSDVAKGPSFALLAAFM